MPYSLWMTCHRDVLSQETHQELADRTQYCVVELSHEHNVPTVLAKPSNGQVADQPLVNFDLARHYMGKS